ncbi:DciA family protein, partial [Thiocapsa sp.]|uniref:DciA family protein n=1 Tax=Thiocapsa sp. TaxID=2024551 RepID=UPI0025F8F87D
MLHPRLAHVRELLQSNRLIRKHLEHRDRELALLGMVLNRLPDPLRTHCRDATLSGGVLTLVLDSPAWVTRARFLIEDLTRSLEREGVMKIATQVRIRAEGYAAAGHRAGPVVEPVSPARDTNRLSSQAVAHLLGAADGMPDPTLAEVFRRFAKHHIPAARAAAGAVGDE